MDRSPWDRAGRARSPSAVWSEAEAVEAVEAGAEAEEEAEAEEATTLG